MTVSQRTKEGLLNEDAERQKRLWKVNPLYCLRQSIIRDVVNSVENSSGDLQPKMELLTLKNNGIASGGSTGKSVAKKGEDISTITSILTEPGTTKVALPPSPSDPPTRTQPAPIRDLLQQVMRVLVEDIKGEAALSFSGDDLKKSQEWQVPPTMVSYPSLPCFDETNPFLGGI